MRRILIGLSAVTLVGCASSTELRARSVEHAEAAHGAAVRGDYQLAASEQAKAQHFYDRAAVRAWQQGRPVPPPPETPPALPGRIVQW